MRLSELKKSLKIIKAHMEKNGGSDIKALEAELKSEVLFEGTNSPIESNHQKLPLPQRKLLKAFKLYKKSYIVLELEVKKIESIISESEKKQNNSTRNSSNDSDIDVDYTLPASFAKNYHLFEVGYADFLLARDVARMELNHPNQLVFSDHEKATFVFNEDDFSDSFYEPIKNQIENILTIFNGNFDLETANKKLKEEKHDTLCKNAINNGFYKDSYSAFFQGQSVFYENRDADKEEVEEKINTFVSQYLKASGFPESMRKNLTGLLTSLCYQSGTGYILSKSIMSFFGLRSSSKELGLDVQYVMQSGNSIYRISFDENFQLKIEYFLISNIFIFMLKSTANINLPFLKKLTLKIDVKVEKDQTPVFNLNSLGIFCAGSIENTTGCTPVLLRNALQEARQSQLNESNIDVFRGLTQNLAKFCGFSSTQSMSSSLGSQTISFPYLIENLQGFRNNNEEKGLDVVEFNFFKTLHALFYESHRSKTELSEVIGNFVKSRIAQLSDDAKLRYVFLLRMAVDLGGDAVKEVKDAYSKLIDSLSKDLPYLFQAAKSDIYFYQAYERNLRESFIFKPPVFSNEEHLAILSSLEQEHLALLVENPELLRKGDKVKIYTEFLALSSERKLKFLLQYSIKNQTLNKVSLPESCFLSEKEQSNLGALLKKNALPEVHSLLTELMVESNVDTVSGIREKLQILFCEYAYSWPLSINSINSRVAMLANEKEDIVEKFGLEFIGYLCFQLNELCNTKNVRLLEKINDTNTRLQEIIAKISSEEERIPLIQLLSKARHSVHIKLTTVDESKDDDKSAELLNKLGVDQHNLEDSLDNFEMNFLNKDSNSSNNPEGLDVEAESEMYQALSFDYSSNSSNNDSNSTNNYGPFFSVSPKSSDSVPLAPTELGFVSKAVEPTEVSPQKLSVDEGAEAKKSNS